MTTSADFDENDFCEQWKADEKCIQRFKKHVKRFAKEKLYISYDTSGGVAFDGCEEVQIEFDLFFFKKAISVIPSFKYTGLPVFDSFVKVNGRLYLVDEIELSSGMFHFNVYSLPEHFEAKLESTSLSLRQSPPQQ